MPNGRRSFRNVKCQQIYPVLGTKKQTSELKTVAFQLNREQAIDLAKKLIGLPKTQVPSISPALD